MGKKPDWPWSIPSYQFSSIWLVRVIISPSLNPSSPSFSGSKSYRARQHGWSMWAPKEKKHKSNMHKNLNTYKYPFYCTYDRFCCFCYHSYSDDSSSIISIFGLPNFVRRQLLASDSLQLLSVPAGISLGIAKEPSYSQAQTWKHNCDQFGI